LYLFDVSPQVRNFKMFCVTCTPEGVIIMKRTELLIILTAGFAAGIIFVYSCGGGSGGSEAIAQTSGYVSIAFMSAVPDSTSNILRYTNYSEKQHANADTTVSWNGVALGLGGNANVYVPIQIPDGAIITEFGITAYDELDDAYPAKAWLKRSPGGPSNRTTMASVETTETAFVPQTVSTTDIEPSTVMVDNSIFGYVIRADLKTGADLAYISAYIK
jgi:hypothetical protein